MTERYRRAPGVVHRDVDDVVVALAPGSTTPVRIEGGAAVVWDAAGDERSLDEVAADAGVAVEEVRAVAEQLVAHGILART